MAGSVAFLLDVLSLDVSLFVHLFRVELEEVRHAAQVGAGRRKTIRLVDERGHALNGLTIFIPQ